MTLTTDSMFLSQLEILHLTGYRTRPAQVRALNQMGIEHKVRPDGRVIVLKSHIEKLLDGSTPISGKVKEKRNEPDWSQFAQKTPTRK